MNTVEHSKWQDKIQFNQAQFNSTESSKVVKEDFGELSQQPQAGAATQYCILTLHWGARIFLGDIRNHGQSDNH